MTKTVQITIFLLLMMCLSVGWISSGVKPVKAATMGINEMALGKIIVIGGQKFVKINSQGLFMSLQKPPYCTFTPSSGTMQSWTTAQCTALTTPTGTNFTQGPCLTDARDGKVYEIRKFSNGKCWMVDNLKYGGDGVDGCNGKLTFDGFGNGTLGANKYGKWTGAEGSSTNDLYGDCIDPSAPNTENSQYCSSGLGYGKCGYLYNWQGVIQSASAYFGVIYYGSETNTQGICPTGWRLPASTSDFQNLFSSVNASDLYYSFWSVNGGWKAEFAGTTTYDGKVASGGWYNYWTSTSGDTNSAVLFGNKYLQYSGLASTYKSNGFSVRCIKN